MGSGIPRTWPNPWTDLKSRSDVRLEWVHELPAGMRGFWQPARRTILLCDWLSMPERRSVLGHELGHVDYRHRHRTGPDGPLLVATQEAEADQLAARRLIDLTMLGVVADLPTTVAAALLFVSPRVVRARLRHLHPSERHYLRRAVERNRKDTA